MKMARKRSTAEQIITKLREAEVDQAKRLNQCEHENARLKKLVEQMTDLATRYGRYGYRRLHHRDAALAGVAREPQEDRTAMAGRTAPASSG